VTTTVCSSPVHQSARSKVKVSTQAVVGVSTKN
jgi:hypothetical protein